MPKKICARYSKLLLSKLWFFRNKNTMSYSKQNTEWSKSKREKQILHIKAHGWNLQKRYRWTTCRTRREMKTQRTDMYTQNGAELGDWHRHTNTILCKWDRRLVRTCRTYSTEFSSCSVLSWIGEMGGIPAGHLYTYNGFTSLHRKKATQCCKQLHPN